jgi:Cu+-exporting ATPase
MQNHELERLDIPIIGMSCAACASRVEKALSKTDGVDDANVNFAVEKFPTIPAL